MSSLIRPSFHAFTLVMLACACLLVVQTVNTLVGASLLPLPTTPESPHQEPATVSKAPTSPLSFTDGVPKGFKLFAMKPDSIYARLGLKNGDILQRLNGFTLDSPTRALEAYNHLRGSARIELELERDGQLLRKTYAVED